MSAVVESVDYVADMHAFTRRVSLGTLVYEDGGCRLIQTDLHDFLSKASPTTRSHVGLILSSLRKKVASGLEPTPPSAQVFFRELTGAEGERALEVAHHGAGPRRPAR